MGLARGRHVYSVILRSKALWGKHCVSALQFCLVMWGLRGLIISTIPPKFKKLPLCWPGQFQQFPRPGPFVFLHILFNCKVDCRKLLLLITFHLICTCVPVGLPEALRFFIWHYIKYPAACDALLYLFLLFSGERRNLWKFYLFIYFPPFVWSNLISILDDILKTCLQSELSFRWMNWVFFFCVNTLS